MKTIKKGLIGFFAILIIVSCSKKETTPPTGAETNATLLAGAKGGSKSWKIASLSQTDGTTSTTLTTANGIPSCEADNIFMFSNNATQSYQATDGATPCTTGDPATYESGSWAFTTDGKSLLIDASVYVTSTQASAEPLVGFFVLSQGVPLTVSQITDSSMTITYSYTDTTSSPAVTYTFTVVFAKV